MWFVFYGIQLGFQREEWESLVLGELYDLIACYQIKREGATIKNRLNDEDIIPDVR